MLLLVWLHVVAMVTAACVFVGWTALIRLLVARATPSAAREAIVISDPLFAIGGIASGVGIVSGLVLARGFGYGAPWLIGAYVLTVAAAVLGVGIDARWARRLAAADDATYATVRRDRAAAISGPVLALIWAAILWLMVAKPA